MRFVKMHGIGNDYIYLDAISDPAVEQRDDLAVLARRMSNRHTGIGSDGIILICPPRAAENDVRMRMFNADGSESEMCGNGVRCVAKFAHDRFGLGALSRSLRVETGRGVLVISLIVESGRMVRATVAMGAPIFELSAIPADASMLVGAGHECEFDIQVGEQGRRVCLVSMGNPHAVEFVDEIEGLSLDAVGPQIEHHRAFPNRINYHVARVAAWDKPRGGFDAEIWMKTWERGAGPTLACGTGACGVVAAAVRTGRMRVGAALVHLPGGDLAIQYGGKNTDEVLMTGPAVEVFEGEWPEPRPQVRERAVLRTERLLLRPLEMSDAVQLVEVCKDREIAANTLTIPHPYTIRDALRWLASLQPGQDRSGHTCFAICLREDDRLIGTVGLVVQKDHERAEIGYTLAKPLWNHGYATEAVRAVIDYAFRTLGLNRVYASHYARNPASGRVMEKVGMTPEGTARKHVKKWGVFEDCVQYAILRPGRSDSTGGAAP